MNQYKIIKNAGRGTLTIVKIVRGVGKWGWCNLSIPEGASVNLSALYPRAKTSRSAALEAAVDAGVVTVVEHYRNIPPIFTGKRKVVEVFTPSPILIPVVERSELIPAPAKAPDPIVVPAPTALIPADPTKVSKAVGVAKTAHMNAVRKPRISFARGENKPTI